MVGAGAFTSGCRAPYLVRLAYEEARFLGAATPATELLATRQDPAGRRALEALLEVRAFAAREGLHVGGSYEEVTDVSSASPFHVVTAAYADRLEAYTWWYPLVGAIPYRGYFDRDSAERQAARLRAEGLDTRIVEASAYSTLGWFDDPLPSSVLDRGERAVVVTVLHELVHQTFFAKGQVAFNETLATAASWRLAERYYAGRGDDAAAARMVAAREAWIRRSDVLDAAAARLRGFYDRSRREAWPRDRLLVERKAMFEEILSGIRRADPSAGEDLDGGLDNASFLASHRYAMRAREVDAFLGSRPSVATALADLERIVERGRTDLFDELGAARAEAP